QLSDTHISHLGGIPSENMSLLAEYAPARVLSRHLLDPGRGPALLVRRLAALLQRRVAHAGSRQALACPDRRLVGGGRLVLMCQGRECPAPAGIGECWVSV